MCTICWSHQNCLLLITSLIEIMFLSSRSWMLPCWCECFKTNLAWKNPLPIANLKKHQGKRWWKRLAREPWLTSDKQNCFVAVVAVAVVVVFINWFVALFPQECLSPSVQLCPKVFESGGDGSLDKLVGNLDQRPCSHSFQVLRFSNGKCTAKKLLAVYDKLGIWKWRPPGRRDSEHGSQIMLKFYPVNLGNVLNATWWTVEHNTGRVENKYGKICITAP